MKNKNLFTQILLVLIVIFLAIIALKPIFEVEPIQAASGGKFDHLKFDFETGMMGTPVIIVMDTRKGDIWAYELDEGKVQYVGTLVELGKPLVKQSPK